MQKALLSPRRPEDPGGHSRSAADSAAEQRAHSGGAGRKRAAAPPRGARGSGGGRGMAEPRAGPERVRARRGSPEGRWGTGPSVFSGLGRGVGVGGGSVRSGRACPGGESGPLLRAAAESPRGVRIFVPVRSQENEYDKHESP